MIIDAHAHVFPDRIAKRATDAVFEFYGFAKPKEERGTAALLTEQLKAAGVDKAIVHSSATNGAHVGKTNDWLAALPREHFIPFGTMHPEMQNKGEEIERMISLGLKGIKLHPDFQQFSMDDPLAEEIYEAAEGKLPILFHTGDYRQDYSNPKRLLKMMRKYPGLSCIAAHMGGWSVWESDAQCLYGENVYFDTSSTLWFISEKKAVELIREHGADKILFGTDYPVMSVNEELKRFNRLELTEEEREKILSKNVLHLLGDV